MNHFKISTRLAVSFALLVLLMAVLGGVALLGSSTQSEALNQVTQRQMPINQALGIVLDGTNEQAIQFRNIGLFNSETIQASARERIKSARADIAAALDRLPGRCCINHPEAELPQTSDGFTQQRPSGVCPER
ncbi:Tar ligand binding domain-containing protein [Comamonas aquatica]|uniref:Tar ligand binding domain-containing protein n=1 Tax=Comamonas aquatica TaxID=225991 RepID=UPI001F1AE7F4|nr:Tar ligand binding domain-containing protein [Comamonas aquatica]